MNLFIDLDTGGAPADVSAQGKTKTFNVAGAFSGFLIIEANCGGEWREVLRFTAAGNRTLDGAFKELRANTNGVAGLVDRITVSADDAGAKFEELPVNGAAVDVSALGTFNTVVIGGDPVNGLLKILISDDGIDFTDWKSYQSSTVDSAQVVTKFMKAEYDGTGIPEVCIGAINETDATATPISAYVFRPGATGDDAPGGNVYTEWTELYAALESTKSNGPRELYFDSRFSTHITALGPEFPACLIPAGTWDMRDVIWRSQGKTGQPQQTGLTVVTWEDFSYCPGLEDIYFHGVLIHDGELHSPLSSAFSSGLTGTCEFVNTNPLAKPICALPDNAGFPIVFNFLDGSQFGASVGPSPTVFDTPAVCIAPVIDAGNNFVFMVGLGVIMTDNAFASGPGGFIGFLGANSAFSGGHSWQQPACPNGFFTETLTSGGVWPRTFFKNADFDLWSNRKYAVDTTAGPVNAQMFDNNASGQPVTIFDVFGTCGVNNVEVLAPPSFGTVEAPYLNRPFQSKTWLSDGAGNWILDKNAFEEFVTDTIVAAQTAINNATNVCDSDPGTFALTLPLAATAKKGAKITVVNKGVGAVVGGVAVTAGVGDTVLGVTAITDGLFGTWQSDGLLTWIKVA